MIPHTPRCDALSQTRMIPVFLVAPFVHGFWVRNLKVSVGLVLVGLTCSTAPGIIWAMIVPGVNQFFFLRYPSVTVTNTVAQLVSYPMGQLWAKTLPNWRIFGISINPGPFTMKEHVLVTVMATICYQSAFDVRLRFPVDYFFDLLGCSRPTILQCKECFTTSNLISVVRILSREFFLWSGLILILL